MDPNLNLSPERRVPPRKGRRAAPSIPASSDGIIGSTDDLLDSLVTNPPNNATSPINSVKDALLPPRSRRTGWAGCADEGSKSGKSRRSTTNLIEQERFQSPERTKKQASDDDIPLIPDLDEMQEEELLSQPAQAPSVSETRVASISELNSDLMKSSAFSTVDEVNLSLLTNRFHSELDLKEDDVRWTWDLLFTEVASQLRSEWDEQAKPETPTPAD